MSSIVEKADLKEDLKTIFNKFENTFNGSVNTPLHDIRKKAIEEFNKKGFPGIKDEEYKYTHLGKALEKNIDFSKFDNEADLSNEQIKSHFINDIDSTNLVFINGILNKELSSGIDNDDLILLNFSEAYQQYPDEINKHFAKYAGINKDVFIALNTAFARNGAFIKIKDNKVVEKPIALYFINSTANNTTVSYPRNLILVGKNSQVNIVESHTSVGEHSNFTNSLTEILVEDNAHINYFIIEDESDNAYHVSTTQINQVAPSVINAYNIALNGAMIRNNLDVVIDSENCEANMYGMYLLHNKAHVDNHTAVDHKRPHSYSNELYKGIMDGYSNGVFNGKIYVRQDAQKTNAFQSNGNIIISDNAKVNSKPQLEIWADDVKCSHGCTTGQIDKEQLFYLRSRGIKEENAKALLLYAFINDIVENIRIPGLKKYIQLKIADRLYKDLHFDE